MDDRNTAEKTASMLGWGLAYALAIVVIAALAMAAHEQSGRTDAARAFTARTTLIQQQALALENVVARMEASQRGFLVTGAARMLEARDADFKHATKAVGALRVLIVDPDQAKRLGEIERAIAGRYAFMREVAIVARRDGLEAGRRMFAATGTAAYARLDAQFDRFSEAQARLLALRSDAARRQADDFQKLLAAGTLTAIVLLLLSGGALLRQLRAGAALQASLHSALALNRLVMDHSPDVICVIDATGRFVTTSNASGALWGYRPSELAGRAYLDLVHPEDRARTQEAAALVMSGEPMIGFSNRYIRADGSTVEVDWSATWSARDALMFCVARDATERRRHEDAIRALNADLHSKAELLAHGNRELEAFSYTVSHDLRAPLRHINGYAQMLVEDAGDALDPVLRRYLDNICEASARMGRLIDDLLAFSRLGRRKVDRSQVDMGRLVREALDEVAGEARPDVVVGELPEAHADPALLRQVWTNLLSNALKYSAPRGADARVEVEGERRDGMVRYRVRDNGVGFDPAHADKLFGVFQRLHTLEEFEGTGVGLAIVERIIRSHGGEVSAEASPGLGATFAFQLPDPPGQQEREVAT